MQKKLSSTLLKFSFISLLALALPVLIIEKNELYFIILSENSILYIYSTIAQVLSGLMALTLVALPYLYNLLERKLQEDESLETAVSIAKLKVFEYFLMIFIIGIVSILFCLLSLGTFNYLNYQNYSLTVSTCSFLYFLFIFLYLIFYSFDPQRLSKISDAYVKNYLELKKDEKSPIPQVIAPDGIKPEEISENLQVKEKNNLHSSIGNFFIEYSKFENNINNYYNTSVKSSKNLSLISKIHALNNFNLISDGLHNEIIDIRVFRNALAHTSHQMDLNKDLIDNLTLKIEKINKIIENNFKNSPLDPP